MTVSGRGMPTGPGRRWRLTNSLARILRAGRQCRPPDSVEADLRFDPVAEQVGVVAGDEVVLQLALRVVGKTHELEQRLAARDAERAGDVWRGAFGAQEALHAGNLESVALEQRQAARAFQFLLRHRRREFRGPRNVMREGLATGAAHAHELTHA